jgi:hypothetical protein
MCIMLLKYSSHMMFVIDETVATCIHMHNVKVFIDCLTQGYPRDKPVGCQVEKQMLLGQHLELF